jgi:phage FluMu protein Com
MIQDFRCERCHHLRFKGSLKLLVGKRTTGDDSIEVQCPRCHKKNRFTYNAGAYVRKRDEPTQGLFTDVATSCPKLARSLHCTNAVDPSEEAA